MKISVLQLLPSLNRGGVERTMIDVVAGLAPLMGEETIFVASEGGELEPALEKTKVKHFTLPLKTKNPFKILANAFRIRSLILEYRISVVHAHSRAPAWSTILASKMTGIPMITTYHGAHQARSFLKRLYNSSMVRGKAVIAMSDYMARYIEKNHPAYVDRVNIIPMGIDRNYFDPDKISLEEREKQRKEWGVKSDEMVVLLPGRKSGWKGYEVFADAIELLKKEKVVGLIVGGELDKPRPQIRVVEHAHAMPIVYMAADIVVSASTQPESFGRVMAESGAMGCVRVGTDLGATPELCSYGESGILVQPNDAASLAEGILKALHLSKEEKENLGLKSRHLIRTHYDYKSMILKKYDLYQKVVLSNQKDKKDISYA